MRGMATLARRVEALEREWGDGEAWQARVAAMSDEELRQELRRLEGLPSERLTADERAVKGILGLSDLELQHLCGSTGAPDDGDDVGRP
jgi:hypothetical protein